MMKPRILVVAGDAPLRATLARWLLAAGYAVELAESPRRARQVVAEEDIALAIVAPDGLDAADVALTRELGGQVKHVIFIEAEATEGGTPAGARIQPEACIPRPLSEPGVLAQVRSALSAAPIREEHSAPGLLRFEGYTLDAGARACVDAKGQEVTLTRAEFSLLLAFARQPGRVLSRDELTRVVAGRGAEPEDRSVDVLISRLRRKIEPDPKAPRIIVTIPGEGYKFTAKPQAAAAIAPAAPAPPSTSFTVPEVEEALDKGADARGAGLQGSRTLEAKTPGSVDRAPARPTTYALGAVVAAAVVLIVAAVGWDAWSNRSALRQAIEVMPRANSPEAQPSSAPPQPGSAEAERRAAVFRRMVAAMRDNRFDWRTLERLAIESGVSEPEAHEILAEHPDEVTLGKSRDGKVMARLSDR
jgi:DNA-binding response OmpR family regulator